MDSKTFIYDLQFDTDKAKPADWVPDWEDAPLPYKLYRRLPAIPLSPDIPLSFEREPGMTKPDLRSVGHFLWYVYGISQVSRTVPAGNGGEETGPAEMYRRVVPSGGGLYPNELYVYLKLEDLPPGVYHYDSAHHRLILLREGNFDAYLGKALGNRCRIGECFGTVFVSTMFWKNFFKYHNFAYRLQGLDAGVVIGQLLAVAERFGYSPAVYFQYLDRAIHRLLGLKESEESVYAILPLNEEQVVPAGNAGRSIDSAVLCRDIPPVDHEHYVRSRHLRDYPNLIRMNEACLMDSTDAFCAPSRGKEAPESDVPLWLPAVNRPPLDLAVLSRRRYSPETDFVLKRVGLRQLAGLLQETAAFIRYVNDLDGGPADIRHPRLYLYGCLYGIEGIEDGAYRYDAGGHALHLIRPGDHRIWLQYGMTLHNVNLFQVPLTFHIAGDLKHGETEYGARGYRIQQMEAGMLTQWLLLAAASSGMAGRPLLGYDSKTADELYRLAPAGQTALIQIPVGPYKYRARWEGSLHL